MPDHLALPAFALSVASFVLGAFLLFVPAGFIVAGLVGAFLTVAADRSASPDPPSPSEDA